MEARSLLLKNVNWISYCKLLRIFYTLEQYGVSNEIYEEYS